MNVCTVTGLKLAAVMMYDMAVFVFCFVHTGNLSQQVARVLCVQMHCVLQLGLFASLRQHLTQISDILILTVSYYYIRVWQQTLGLHSI